MTYSVNELAEVARLYREGRSLREVGSLFGRGVDWAKARVLAAGLPLQPGGAPGRIQIDSDAMRRMFDAGLRRTEIATAFGCSTWKVDQVIAEQGWTRRRPRKSRTLPPLDVARLRSLYVEQGKSVRQVADELHTTPHRVRTSLDAAGIRPRPRNAPHPAAFTASVRIGYAQGRPFSAIARDLGVSVTKVRTALRHQGITPRPDRLRVPPVDIDEATMRHLYVTCRLDDNQIAERYGVPPFRIRTRRRQLGVRRDFVPPPHPAPPPRPAKTILARAYTTDGLTLQQIAHHYHSSTRVVRGWMAECGIAVKERTNRQHRKTLDVELVRELYEDDEWSAPEIAAELDTTVHLVLRTLHDNGVAVRPGGPPRRRSGPQARQLLLALYADTDVKALLRRHNLPARPRPGPIADRFPTPVEISIELLREAYEQIGLSARHIELLTGYPAGQILDELHRAGIEVRTRSGPSPWPARSRQRQRRTRGSERGAARHVKTG